MSPRPSNIWSTPLLHKKFYVMKVVVTGGRNYNDFVLLDLYLRGLSPTHIYVGDATGADALARSWAELNKVKITVFYADWKLNGKRAGPIRNTKMLVAAGPDATVLAFPGGRGTSDCVSKANVRGNKIVQVS